MILFEATNGSIRRSLDPINQLVNVLKLGGPLIQFFPSFVRKSKKSSKGYSFNYIPFIHKQERMLEISPCGHSDYVA